MINFEDRFHPATLKRKRIVNFKLDVERFYAIFLSLEQNPHEISMRNFRSLWIDSEMIYLHWCRIADEEPEEYYQALYQLIIQKFFESEHGKVFTLYSLYFLYFGSEDKIRINVDCRFVDGIRQLVKEERVRKNLDICFACRKLFNVFVYASRCGVRTILVRENGQPTKKERVPELEMEGYGSLEEVLRCDELRKVSQDYEKKKNKQAEVEYGFKLKQTDKHFSDRIEELLANFKKNPQ